MSFFIWGKIDAIALKGSCHEGLLGAVADEAASSVVNAVGAMADEGAAGAAGCCCWLLLLVDGVAVGALGIRIIAKKSREKLGGVVGLSLLNFIGDQNNLIKIDYRSYI